MWTGKISNVVLVHGCKRYAVCEPYVRTHACTHAQTNFSNSQLNTLVWGSLTLIQQTHQHHTCGQVWLSIVDFPSCTVNNKNGMILDTMYVSTY